VYSSAVDFGRKPVAVVSLRKTGAEPNPLAGFITRRQTGRLAYTGGMLVDSDSQTLKACPEHGTPIFWSVTKA